MLVMCPRMQCFLLYDGLWKSKELQHLRWDNRGIAPAKSRLSKHACSSNYRARSVISEDASTSAMENVGDLLRDRPGQSGS